MLREALENELAVARAPVANRRDLARGCGSTPPISAEETMSTNATDSVIVEIRGAEGGDDAKLLVLEQVKIYLRLCGRRFL